MTPDEIMRGMSQKNLLLQKKNEELLELSEKRAQAERDYNVTVAVETLNLKTEGHQVTLIPTLCKGNKSVSDLKYSFDVADGVYKACLESIKDIRSALDTYRSLLSWMKAELESR